MLQWKLPLYANKVNQKKKLQKIIEKDRVIVGSFVGEPLIRPFNTRTRNSHHNGIDDVTNFSSSIQTTTFCSHSKANPKQVPLDKLRHRKSITNAMFTIPFVRVHCLVSISNRNYIISPRHIHISSE